MECDQFCWGARAAKNVLKVNPRNSTEPWWSTDEPILFIISYLYFYIYLYLLYILITTKRNKYSNQ